MLKILFKNMFTILILLISVSLQNEITDDMLDNYQIKFENSLKYNKLNACLRLVETSIEKGNDDLKKQMKETKLNKDNFYSKYILAMMNKCITNISLNEVFTIIRRNFNNDDFIKLEKLITINKKIETDELTENEINIQKDIEHEIETNAEILKKNDINTNKQSILKYLIPIILFILTICFSFTKRLFTSKKTKDPKEKEVDEEELRKLFGAKKRV